VKRIFFLFLTLYAANTFSQTTQWQDALQQWTTTEEMEESYGSETLELLEELTVSKINLNQTTREELEQLPFLSAQQVEGIMEYVYRYGPMRSLSELQMITALDYDIRHLLQYFVTAGPEQPKSVWPLMSDIKKYGRHTLMVSGKIPLYERRGDRNGYLGYKYRHDLRYQFNYNSRIKFGLTAAQDAGEPFFANCNSWGYDHYSYYLQLRDFGWLKALNVGMYRVQMGMGLLMNTGFHLGKLATLQSLGRSTHLLTAHASRSSSGYLRGAAATIQLSPRCHLTAFASHRPIDATLAADGSARTLLTDGYHRTPTEVAKKHNTQETDLGFSGGWRKGTLYVNANMLYTHLNRKYADEGQDFLNASLDYGYNSYRFSLAGETAVNRNGALAMIHSLGYHLSEQLSLTAIHRFYDQRYTALHARSFSEGSSVQNEHGLYLGTTWKPSWSWVIQGYVDYAHFSGPRYQATTASDAFDGLLSARYDRKKWSIDSRLRFHIRQRDNDNKTHLVNRTESRLRLGCNYVLLPELTLRSQADAVSVAWMGQQKKGLMLSQQASWQWHWLQVKARCGWFRTDDYDSRIYQYESSLRYDYSYPMFYGHGLRYAVMAHATPSNHLSLTAKIGVTNYFDRSIISSGLQQVNASSMADLLLQVRYIL
jgi:hypothetical protein